MKNKRDEYEFTGGTRPTHFRHSSSETATHTTVAERTMHDGGFDGDVRFAVRMDGLMLWVVRESFENYRVYSIVLHPFITTIIKPSVC